METASAQLQPFWKAASSELISLVPGGVPKKRSACARQMRRILAVLQSLTGEITTNLSRVWR
jgi:hypothetical protein